MKIHWIGAGVVLALAIASFFYVPVVTVFLLPVFAWYASRIIVHGGFGLWSYATQGVKEEWNGRHFEFGGAKLRAEETDDELVFLEEDILVVIEQPGSKVVQLFGPKERFLLTSCEEMALTQAGCERLLLKSTHRDAKKLMLFLQREAFFPYLKRHGKLKTTVGRDGPPATATKTSMTTEEKS
jgi:hypothetical protein